MIDASTAYNRTKYQEQTLKFKKDIEEGIERAISEGKYGCEVAFNCDLPTTVRNEISKELEENGYHFMIPAYEKEPADIPCDQAKYYDYLTINWGKPYGNE